MEEFGYETIEYHRLLSNKNMLAREKMTMELANRINKRAIKNFPYFYFQLYSSQSHASQNINNCEVIASILKDNLRDDQMAS